MDQDKDKLPLSPTAYNELIDQMIDRIENSQRREKMLQKVINIVELLLLLSIASFVSLPYWRALWQFKPM